MGKLEAALNKVTLPLKDKYEPSKSLISSTSFEDRTPEALDQGELLKQV